MLERKNRRVELKVIFPTIDPERVKTLMESPNFKLRQALRALHRKIEIMKTAGLIGDGQDLKKFSERFDAAYPHAMRALYGRLAQEGYQATEINAAKMVAEKAVKLTK